MYGNHNVIDNAKNSINHKSNFRIKFGFPALTMVNMKNFKLNCTKEEQLLFSFIFALFTEWRVSSVLIRMFIADERPELLNRSRQEGEVAT